MKEFNLTVTEQEADLIGLGINELQRKVSDLFINLKNQIHQQQVKVAMPPAPPDPPIFTLGDVNDNTNG